MDSQGYHFRQYVQWFNMFFLSKTFPLMEKGDHKSTQLRAESLFYQSAALAYVHFFLSAQSPTHKHISYRLFSQKQPHSH